MSLDAAGRLERLMAAGELADGTTEAPEVVPRLLDLVVPSVAGACLLHQFREGALECTGARGIAPVPHPPARPDAEPVLTEDGAVVVPLRVRGRTTGWLTYAHDGFGAGDLRYLQVLSNRLAVALDNARLVLAERQLEALVAGMEEAVTVRDGDGRILLGNDAAVRLLGASSQEELRRTSLTDLWRRFALYRPDGTPMSDGDLSWMRALQDERPPPMLMRRVDRGTGEEQWLLEQGDGAARRRRAARARDERDRGRDRDDALRARSPAARRRRAPAVRGGGLRGRAGGRRAPRGARPRRLVRHRPPGPGRVRPSGRGRPHRRAQGAPRA